MLIHVYFLPQVRLLVIAVILTLSTLRKKMMCFSVFLQHEGKQSATIKTLETSAWLKIHPSMIHCEL